MSRTAMGANSRTAIGSTGVDSGVASWTLKVSGQPALLGVATHGIDCEKWLGGDAHGWCMDGSDGQKAHGGQWSAYTAKRFGSDSTVVLSVDLARRTLSYTCDGQDCGVAFTDITGPVFVAVSLKVGGSVRIVNFTGGGARGRGGATRRFTRASRSPAAPSTAAGESWGRLRARDMAVVNGGATLVRTAGESQSVTALASTPAGPGTTTWRVQLGGGPCILGVATATANLDKWLGSDNHGWGMDGSDGQKCHSGTWAGFGPKFNNGDVVDVRYNRDRGTLEISVRPRPPPAPLRGQGASNDTH